MDRVARIPNVIVRVGRGISAFLLLSLLLVPPGCHWGGHGATPPPQGREELAGDNAAPVVMPEWLPPAVATGDAEETAEVAEVADVSPPDNTANTAIGAPEATAPAASPLPEAKGEAGASAPLDNAARSVPSPSAGTAAGTANGAEARPSSHRQKPAAALHPVPAAPPKETRIASVPGWAKGSEELVYRVDFIGITMGYARFRYEGKVLIAGKSAYHLNVRAWTSGILAYIYPINDTIDYYLDTETLAPIRQEFSQRAMGREDVALFNQETGKITYRYRETGAIRKQVETLPSIYDPVSVAYYFRWRDLGVENRPRNVYGGRKVYQISTRVVGHERIRTDHGEMDTIAVVPVIRRDGKPDNKGDLKIWFSGDERRVPVRLYAKFRKIKEWTLVGELMPPATAKAGR